MYVFVLYIVVLGDASRPTPFDREFLDLADQLRTAMGVDVAKVVSAFGTLPAVSDARDRHRRRCSPPAASRRS